MKNFAGYVLAVAGTLSVAACSSSGNNAGPGQPGGGGAGGGPGTGGSSSTDCNPNASFAPARISLITDAEYTNMVRDVFGVEFVPEAKPVNTGDYPLNETASVASVDVAKQYFRAAEQVAAKVKPCGDAPVAAACVEAFLRTKLPRLWKRPVTDAEITGLMAIFNGGLPDGAPRAMDMVMQAALVGGAYLYRTEVGTDASGLSGSVAMTPFELANAVSFSLLATTPDDALWAKAVDGTITQPAVLSAEVDRLLALQPARDLLTKKVGYYLNIEKIPVVGKDTATFPEYTATLRSSLYQSAQLFLNDLVWTGSLGDLFSSNTFYANDEISKVFGLPAVQGSGLMPVQLPAERNAGFLSHPGLLATSNTHAASDDIVHRGLWIHENLVCGVAIGTPPPGAADIAKSMMGTEREKAEQRLALPTCGGCHRFFDPFGMASGNFDAIGRYRTIDPEDNKPVVSQATVSGVGEDMDGPVSGLKEIADRLKGGRRAADCAVGLLTKYTLDHNANEENSCAIQQVKDSFAKSGKFVDLFKAILTSPAFANRDLASK